MLHTQVCTYKEKLPGPTITAKRCTQIPNRCGCCFIRSVHWPSVLHFGTQGATLHAKFYAEHFPPTVSRLQDEVEQAEAAASDAAAAAGAGAAKAAWAEWYIMV